MNKNITITEIDEKEALRYIGANGTDDSKVLSIMEESKKKLIQVINPKYVYKCFDFENTQNGVHIIGCDFDLLGNDIKNHLEGCEKVILMGTTLSAGVDRLIRVCEIKDLLYALCTDALASAAIEQVCEKVEEIIHEEFPEYNMTFRYGIGYGDLPISLQKDFIKCINADKLIGLNATESFILTPRKSVTCIIGLSKNEIAPKRKGCAVCNMRERCTLRKRGLRCNV